MQFPQRDCIYGISQDHLRRCLLLQLCIFYCDMVRVANPDFYIANALDTLKERTVQITTTPVFRY